MFDGNCPSSNLSVLPLIGTVISHAELHFQSVFGGCVYRQPDTLHQPPSLSQCSVLKCSVLSTEHYITVFSEAGRKPPFHL